MKQQSPFDVKIEARYLPSRIADRIQTSIVSGQYEVGDRLPSERELAESFRVSRTVIREAMVLLQERGLVSVQSGSGVYVTTMETATISRQVGIYVQRQQISIAQLYEVRWILEVQNAQLAAQRATKERIQELQATLEKSRENLNNPSEFTLLDVEFHRQIASASENPVLLLLFGTVTDALQAHLRLTEQLPGAQANALKHHFNIFSAVAAKDVEGAGKAMEAHLRSSWDWLLQAFANSEEEIGAMAFVDLDEDQE